MKRTIAAALAALLAMAAPAAAKDLYVSAERGKGKKATKDAPAKDLGNIISKLEPGDTVHIAGGVYTGRGDSGVNLITVPVSIIGGYSDDFATRDPWGAHRTVFFGDNLTKNYESGPSLMIDLMKYDGPNHPVLVDGIIVDHSGRNRYRDRSRMHEVLGMANPKTGENPSPALGSLVIRVSKSERFDQGPRWKVTVQNCIVMNGTTTQGILSVGGYKDSEITIRNNLVVNNSGFAIFAGSKFHGDGPPKFLIENNTVLFTWRHSINNETGASLGLDRNVAVTVRSNVFAFADRYGINNGLGTKDVLLQNNNICGNITCDYKEPNMAIAWKDVEDEAELLHDDSEGNVSEEIVVPVDKAWAELYASRVVVDREKLEADVKAEGTATNALRRMLGLPVQGGKVDGPTSPVFVHAMTIDDAVKAGAKAYGGRGCSMPK